MKANTSTGYLTTALTAGLGLGAALFAFTGVAQAATDTNAETTMEWVVDYRGRPPYKRERVPVETVDVAALETVPETTVIWERSSRGRPPFKRRWVEVPVIDAASIELDDGDAGPVFRGRPPFKRN